MKDVFKLGVRKKIRFASAKGLLTMEDLFELPLTTGATNLNSMARERAQLIRENSQDNFVANATTGNAQVNLELEILKEVITIRVKENKSKVKSAERAKQRTLILDIIDEKQNEELKNNSIKELKKML